jgi:predicted nucleotidyltransferase
MQAHKPVIEQSMAHIRHLARPVLDALAAMRKVVGIACFGSYALGTADRHSDVDLLVLCYPSVMPVATRQTVLATLPATQHYHDSVCDIGWEEPWAAVADKVVLEAITVDIVYQTQAWLTEVVDQVLTTGALSTPAMPFRPYTMLGLLDTGVVLYDPVGIMARLRQRVRPYPAVLQANIVRAYEPLMVAGVTELQDYAHRDIGPDAFLFHEGDLVKRWRAFLGASRLAFSSC